MTAQLAKPSSRATFREKMTVAVFIQTLINGLSIGMLLVLIVLGLDIILRVTSILNFAHGQFYMIGAIAFFFTYEVFGLPFVVALISALVVMLLLGGIAYLAIFNFVLRRFTPATHFSFRLLMSAMASVGLMMILSQGALLTFGTTARGVHSVFPQIITISDIIFPAERLAIIAICLLAMLGLYLLMFKTKLGKSMRAVSLDSEVSSLQGINAHRTYLMGFAIGCCLAGLAGAMIAPVFAVTTDMGHLIIFTAMMVMLAGGIGSYRGAILGGIVIGLISSFGYYFIGGLYELLLFTAVIVILIFRPGGLLGEKLD